MGPVDLVEFHEIFDDFEAIFFPNMAEVIRDQLERFAFTEDVVLDPGFIMMPHGPDYDEARR